MEDIEAMKTENESLKAREEQLKLQLSIAIKKIKKLEGHIINIENIEKNGNKLFTHH